MIIDIELDVVAGNGLAVISISPSEEKERGATHPAE
jgi:hypothetical protein